MLAQNPYIAGNPVGKTQAFVGRHDVLREVLRVMKNPGQNAITLYGQRRIGKTSVLQNLEMRLPQEGPFRAVYFDLQDKASLSLDNLLNELRVSIASRLGTSNSNLGSDAKTTFRSDFLPGLLNDLPPETSLVLLLDEFDVLAEPKSGQAASDFFPYLRELIALYPQHLQFVFVLGRNITDLSSIALSLFKGVPSRRVSLLTRSDTEKLIVLAHQNNTLKWSDEATTRVWSFTNGHPFLTQALCSSVWEMLYETEPETPPQVKSSQVEEAIPNALEASRNTLEWLWGGLGPAQRVVASAFAAVGEKPVTNEELEKILRESGVRILVRELQDAPQLLQDWDIIEPVEDGYTFRVELLRRWLAEHKPLNRVQKEIDRIQPVAENLFQAASGYYETGDLSQAQSLLLQAIRLNPSHVRANELLAEILISEANFSEARELLEKLLEFAPNAARGRLIQVYLSQAQNSSEDRIKLELFERVLGLDPSNPEARSAVQTINKLTQEEKELTFRFIEGRQALQKGEWKLAQESLHWVVTTRPDYSYDNQFATDMLAEAIRSGKIPPPVWKVWLRNRQVLAFLGGAVFLVVLVFSGAIGSDLVSLGRNQGIGPFAGLAPTKTPTPLPTFTPTPTITPNSIFISNQMLIDLSKSALLPDDLNKLSSTITSFGYESIGSKSSLDLRNLNEYKLVVVIGNSYIRPYSAEEAILVENYVRNGGRLILVSEDQATDHPEYLQELGNLFGLEILPSNSNESCSVIIGQEVVSNISSVNLGFAGKLKVSSEWQEVCVSGEKTIIASRTYGFGKIVAIADSGILYDQNLYDEDLVTMLITWLITE